MSIKLGRASSRLLGYLGLMVLGCSFSIGGIDAQDLVKGKAAQIRIGTSTWKDVAATFGKSYLIDEPGRNGERSDVWEMVYPLHPEYGVHVSFTINRSSGIVEMRNFGEPEPEIVRSLVTEFHAPYCSPKPPWIPGQWNGITIGRSTPADVEAKWGKGSAKACPGSRRRVMLIEYSKLGDFDGKVTVSFGCNQAQTVEFIFNEPSSPWSLERTFQTLGTGYCYRRFIVTSDSTDLESGRLIEDPRGNWVQVEYRRKGLVLSPDSDGNIRALSFQKNPPAGAGKTSPSDCPSKNSP